MSDTSNVAGYFNGNSYPIQIAISVLGQVYTLGPGEFITALDQSGKKVKVNDPLFDAYVGKMRLSKEILKDKKVPIYRVQSRDERGQVSFMQTAPIKTAGDGKLVTPVLPRPIPASGPNSPVRGMSVAEAIENGLIPKPRIRHESTAPKETDGAPLRGESLPEIEYDDADVRNYKPRQKMDNTVIGDKVNLDVSRDTAIPMPQVPGLVAPAQTPDVPTPSMDEVDEALSAKEELPFVCDLDSPPRRFQFRSQLESYLRKAHPDKLESYMARYPKKSK
jgi:hypothetical protein